MDFMLIPVLAFMGFICYILFSQKGRSFGRKVALGEVIEDYGVIGTQTLGVGGKQQIRLLKCAKNNELFYVLEIQSSGLGAYRVEWIKLNQEAVINLKRLL